MDILPIYTKLIEECHQTICTDTRKIIPGAMFFAWKGEHNDGNQFAQEALDLGCSYVIMDNPDYVVSDRCIVVPDTIEALQNIARYHRRQFNIPVLAITGSNGKTTTKGCIRSVLETEKKVIATEGNLNNHVGVPKTLLGITADTQIAIIEMGANHIGEIALLSGIAEPTHGIITNIGRAHLGLFGGVAGVIQAKTELYNFLRKNNGQVFVNASDNLLLEKSEGLTRTLYGPATSGLFSLESHNTTPFVSFDWNHRTIMTQLTGEYNIDNFAAAIAVGVLFEISPDNIQKGLENYAVSNHRSEMMTTSKGNIIVKDFYNANVTSMEAALKSFAEMKSDKPKLVVLGDMFELGEYEAQEHQVLVDFVQDLDFNRTILVGKAFMNTVSDPDIMKFASTEEAKKYFEKEQIHDMAVFFKASNGMHFEHFFDTLEW